MPKNSDRDFELCVHLIQAYDAFQNARAKELRVYNLSTREVSVLNTINEIGKTATPTKISRWVYRKPNVVTSILSRMQKKGLLKLSKDVKVKNLVRIKLTKKGNKALELSLTRETIHEIFQSIPDDKYEQFKLCLATVRDKALEITGHVIERPDSNTS